ncbi:C39 family peptidase [Mycobacterium sp. 852014-52144_SCH5372336]|uniref:C39 family peptidase n=1 Tax=Mycobacterium sp. 852014-52144_SCH5372336 TaxID=1834115 RepID=UPI0012E6FB22|nr:C39 family peptidase [Mycobacterium sp. 852014-52144_SCH5372336]
MDGPVAPPSGVILLGSLDLVRRDLERMNDDRLTVDPQQVANMLTTQTTSEEWLPVTVGTTSESAAPEVPKVVPTPNERLAALFVKQAERTATLYDRIAERTAAHYDKQVERISAIAERISDRYPDSPTAERVRTRLLAVAERLQSAGFDVVERIFVARFAAVERFHALADRVAPPVGGGGGAGPGGLYGDPEKNSQYWQAQSHGNNCVLMATTMIIGQLNGTMPSEEDIVKEAQETESVANPGRMMYLGPTSDNGVDIKDAVALLDRHGITATVTEYDRADGMKALDALTMALAENKAVMVGVHGETVWNAVEGKPLPEGINTANHQVVILGVDRVKNIVYMNDSGFAEEGKNMKVPLGVFMKAWQTDDFETTVAERKAPETPSFGPASANVSNSGVLVSVG